MKFTRLLLFIPLLWLINTPLSYSQPEPARYVIDIDDKSDVKKSTCCCKPICCIGTKNCCKLINNGFTYLCCAPCRVACTPCRLCYQNARVLRYHTVYGSAEKIDKAETEHLMLNSLSESNNRHNAITAQPISANTQKTDIGDGYFYFDYRSIQSHEHLNGEDYERFFPLFQKKILQAFFGDNKDYELAQPNENYRSINDDIVKVFATLLIHDPSANSLPSNDMRVAIPILGCWKNYIK